MHRGVGLTSLQGDISFSDMRLSYPAKRCQISGPLAIPSTFIIFFICYIYIYIILYFFFSAGAPLRLSELQVALSDAGTLFLLDYTNASGEVIKVGGMDPNQFRRKEEPLDMEALLSSKLMEFLGKPPSGHTSACETRKFSIDLHQFDE